MTYLYYIKSKEIEKESESKEMIKLSIIGLDEASKKANYSTTELLFYAHCIPDKTFLNKANSLIYQEEYVRCKRKIELLEADATVEISKDKTLTNESARKSAMIVLLNDAKSDRSKEYLQLRVDIDKAFHEKEIYTYLAEYHKDLGKIISNHLFQNKVRDELEKDVINNE